MLLIIIAYDIDDHCRVKLKEIAGCEHSDYINASYMDVRIYLFETTAINF